MPTRLKTIYSPHPCHAIGRFGSGPAIRCAGPHAAGGVRHPSVGNVDGRGAIGVTAGRGDVTGTTADERRTGCFALGLARFAGLRAVGLFLAGLPLANFLFAFLFFAALALLRRAGAAFRFAFLTFRVVDFFAMVPL